MEEMKPHSLNDMPKVTQPMKVTVVVVHITCLLFYCLSLHALCFSVQALLPCDFSALLSHKN